MEKQKIVERIRQLMESEGLNASQLARLIGFNQSNLSKILRGDRQVPANLISAILNKTDARREWLVNGEGSMTGGDVAETPAIEQGELITVNPHGVGYYSIGGKLMARVPVMPFNAFGQNYDEWAGPIENTREDGETIDVEVDRVSRGRYVVFTVENDSMDDGSRNSFEEGDKIFVRELERPDWLPRLRYDKWKYWVVAFGNSVRLKQIINQDDHGNITLHSLNPSPEFTDYTLNLDDVAHLFNVIRKIPKTVDYGK